MPAQPVVWLRCPARRMTGRCAATHRVPMATAQVPIQPGGGDGTLHYRRPDPSSLQPGLQHSHERCGTFTQARCRSHGSWMQVGSAPCRSDGKSSRQSTRGR